MWYNLTTITRRTVCLPHIYEIWEALICRLCWRTHRLLERRSIKAPAAHQGHWNWYFFGRHRLAVVSLEVTDSLFLNSDEGKRRRKKKKVAWPKKKNLTCLVGTWSNQTSKINHNFISHCFTSNAHPIWINKYSTEWHYFGEYHFTVPGTRRHPNREELRGKLNWTWQKPRLLKWLVCLYSPWQRETALWHRRLLNASQVLLSATEVQQGCSCAAL